MTAGMTVEDMCRELLSIAVKDGLVQPVEGQPNTYSSGDLVGMADALSRMLSLKQQGDVPEVVIEHVIDLDVNPFIPDGWKVEDHQKGGSFRRDAAQVSLWLADGQQNGKCLNGHKLREELKGKPVFNANMLDYLVANPHLIPESWKGKNIFFWGTIYRNSGGLLYVRYLYWDGSRWSWDDRWLAYVWNADNPAALRAS